MILAPPAFSQFITLANNQYRLNSIQVEIQPMPHRYQSVPFISRNEQIPVMRLNLIDSRFVLTSNRS
ncbi:hypothetical protein Pla22_28660 [Rubripirellula amarantea]|uniref:Uncharacterized protein n=1 Tax=Rubripirellula amarantea TaxID=2527999 RepID=A0A5C5WYQ3_9BACT|nr:hypothetical protein [Rubripirellula amarantea]TWT55211.1 hypothetical protein Pla22_28660 [Rubripirellula amarantea]